MSGSDPRPESISGARGKAYALAEHLGRKILSGALPDNSVIVSREVAADSGMAYTTVREAFFRLQECGLISVRQGHPTRVLAASCWNLLHPDVVEWAPVGGWLHRDVMECRDLVHELAQDHWHNVALRRLDEQLGKL